MSESFAKTITDEISEEQRAKVEASRIIVIKDMIASLYGKVSMNVGWQRSVDEVVAFITDPPDQDSGISVQLMASVKIILLMRYCGDRSRDDIEQIRQANPFAGCSLFEGRTDPLSRLLTLMVIVNNARCKTGIKVVDACAAMRVSKSRIADMVNDGRLIRDRYGVLQYESVIKELKRRKVI
jgi:hypothetical protein